jgi:hypothetical protein
MCAPALQAFRFGQKKHRRGDAMSNGSPQGCLVSILRLFGCSVGDEAESAAPVELPYRRKDYLLSQAERAFFVALQQAVGREYVLFAKVRLLDLVWLPKGTESRQGHMNRVQSKHVDFVVCSRDVLRPLVAIELDDRSHDADDRRQRDVFVDIALRAAGLPLVRFPCRANYDVQEVASRIAGAIGGMP